jgi:SAM-dependent methyltransferase
MESWIASQVESSLDQFDQLLTQHYPDKSSYLENASDYVEMLTNRCNYLRSLASIQWEVELTYDSIGMDLGCGGGWLTAYLSRSPQISRVYAVDASRDFLSRLLPEVFRVMQGRLEKVEPIHALFQPLLLPDASLDFIVASSVCHHANNLESLLKECKRVLKPCGTLFIVNETPYSGLRHALSVTKAFFRILKTLVFRQYKGVSPSISSSGYLIDPILGDRDYPIWYWKKCLDKSGFAVRAFIDSGIPTIEGQGGRTLKHFICVHG